MRVLLEPEHVELVLVPSAHDVEADATVRNMINCRNRLGNESRRGQRHVDGGEKTNPLCQGADRSAVGQRLERTAEIISFTAEPSPFRHRQNEVDAGLIRHHAGLDDVIPFAAPTFGRLADSKAAVAIGIEQAELELVRAENGIGHAIHCSVPQRRRDIHCDRLTAIRRRRGFLGARRRLRSGNRHDQDLPFPAKTLPVLHLGLKESKK